MLRDEEYNIFEQLSFADYKILRKRTISNILATDMKFHFDELEEMKKIQESEVKDLDPLWISGIMIHLADLSSPTKTWEIAKTWSLRVTVEFSA